MRNYYFLVSAVFLVVGMPVSAEAQYYHAWPQPYAPQYGITPQPLSGYYGYRGSQSTLRPLSGNILTRPGPPLYIVGPSQEEFLEPPFGSGIGTDLHLIPTESNAARGWFIDNERRYTHPIYVGVVEFGFTARNNGVLFTNWQATYRLEYLSASLPGPAYYKPWREMSLNPAPGQVRYSATFIQPGTLGPQGQATVFVYPNRGMGTVLRLWITEPGSYRMTVTLTNLNGFPERNYNDNRLAINFVVYPTLGQFR